jgi:hypothetical protein
MTEIIVTFGPHLVQPARLYGNGVADHLPALRFVS